MFFPKRIRGIRPGDRVLEIGPGGHPHPKAAVLLERRFGDEQEAFRQRGHESPPAASAPLVYYDGGRFPFRDRAFDYVICSHVLEHVEDVDLFLAEVSRVAPRGYLEFPTVFYDYMYNFPEHVMLLFFHEDRNCLHWLPKSDTELSRFKPVQSYFYQTLLKGLDEVVWPLVPLFFQGFEFTSPLLSRRVRHLGELLPAQPETHIPPRNALTMVKDWALYNARMVGKIGRTLRERWFTQ
jgi:SAM-dependent methyltransferase